MSTTPLQRATAAQAQPAGTETEPPRQDAHPGRGYLFCLAAAVVGANAALLAAAVLTLSLKATAIDAARATTILSVVVSVAGLATIVAYPALGRLSDRTLGRLGRRRPFLLAGAVLIALGTIGVLLSHGTLALTVGDTVMALGVTAVVVAATATIPDQLAPHQRGVPSAIVGLGTPVGALVGLFAAQAVSPSLPAMIVVPGAVGVVGALLLALVLKDRPITAADRPAFGVVDFFSTFWVNPATSPSFTWAWWSRFLLFFGVAAVNAYQAFYLIRELHVSPAAVAGRIFLATLVLVGMCLVFAPLVAKLSDRIGRRKPFVVAAAVIFAAGLVIVTTAHTYGQFLLAIAVVGLGQGVYFAVDLALVTQLLPDQDNPAKDLGIMNLANNLPTSLVPAVAPALLAVGASAAHPQAFTTLFLAGAVAALVGAVLILPIRGAR